MIVNYLIKICITFVIVGFISSLISCNSCNKPKDPDSKKVVTKIKEDEIPEKRWIKIESLRLDEAIFTIGKSKNELEIQKMKANYGSFFDLYTGKVFNIGTIKDPNYTNYLSDFATDNIMNQVYDKVKKTYPYTTALDEEFSKAFTLYQELFANKSIPKITYMISGFNYAVVCTQAHLGVGLDMYLGADCDFYKQLQFPKYKYGLMRKDLIVADAMRAWLITEFESKSVKQNLLDIMIQEGKALYCLDNILPNYADSTKIGYTQNQIRWLNKNEGRVWRHFVDNKLLFTTSYKQIVNYTKEAPFSMGLPRECPGRVANWLGWQIVRNYMENNKEVGITELMNEKDVQKILSKSAYKPL